MPNRQTLLITQAQVRSVLDIGSALEAVEGAFRAYGEDHVQMPPKPYLYFDRGDLRCMPAYVPELGLATVKNVNAHPDNGELPAVMGTLTVFDPDTGFPLAIMDATWLTAMRTGAAGGVAAKYLARRDCVTVGLIGAGVQAVSQLDALMHVRPGIEVALVHDVDRRRAERLAAECTERHGLDSSVTPAEVAVRRADVLITVTPVRTPVVRDEWVRPGTHINAIGADAPGKQELEGSLLRRARVVVDNWEQASHGGEINVPVGRDELARQDVHGDIGQVVAGRIPGREDDQQITVFDSTGLAIQDCACAARVYRQIVEENAAGDRTPAVDFLD